MFDPTPYEDATIRWRDHLFVQDHVHAIFHVPIDMGAKVTKNKARIDAVGAAPAQPLMLSDEGSPWGSDIFIEVEREVPGAQMATMSGTFRTRVYDGPFSQAGSWVKDTAAWLEAQGQHADAIYLAYTSCPSCAKAFGHNHVVVFARVSADPAVAEA